MLRFMKKEKETVLCKEMRDNKLMKTIVILTGRYLPGYKDGGPVRTLINLTECLGDRYRIKIVANDRDHGDVKAYKDIKYNQSNKVGKAEVWYVKPGGFRIATIVELTKDADMIYVCGPYDDYAYKTLLLKRLKKINKPIVIASMGAFSEGAFNIKSKKKSIFIKTAKVLGLFKSVTWSVTSDLEEMDVKRIIGKNAKCIIAEDLPRAVPVLKNKSLESNIKIIFVSRISKKKNLSYAIEVLSKVTNDIIFDIYGPIEEKEYWEKCKRSLQELPSNIRWKYKGMADSEKIIELFSQYDIFLFPTLGENFGHVIFEALAGGCIPVISDQTPWNDLKDCSCGEVISLSSQDLFAEAINRLARLPKDELWSMQRRANEYAKKKYENSVANTGYIKIFEKVLK